MGQLSPIAFPEFINAIAREMRTITKPTESDILWKTSGDANRKSRLTFTIDEGRLGRSFLLLQGKTKSQGQNLLKATLDSSGLMTVEIGSGVSTQAAFSREEEEKERKNPKPLTTVQQLYKGEIHHEKEPIIKISPVELLGETYDRNDEKATKIPHAKSFRLVWPQAAEKPTSGYQIFRSDDNINLIDFTMTVVTTHSVWILMLPEPLVSEYDSSEFSRLSSETLRKEGWFLESIREQVRELWEEAIKGTGQEPVDGALVDISVLRASKRNGPTRLNLHQAILQEMWEVSQELNLGPLKGDFKSKTITSTPFLFERRVPADSDRVSRPRSFFVVENHYVKDLEDTYFPEMDLHVKGPSLSVLSVSYGSKNIITGMIENPFEDCTFAEDIREGDPWRVSHDPSATPFEFKPVPLKPQSDGDPMDISE